jgi:hypothetical protein
MKKIAAVFILIALLSVKSYAQDFKHIGGLYIHVGPTRTETVKGVAEFLITDPEGRKSGLDVFEGNVVQGIPSTVYDKERIDDLETGEPGAESVILESYAPINGLYKMIVVGTASGQYSIEINARDINFKRSSQELYGITYIGKIDNYEITYSSAPGSQVMVIFAGSSEVPVFDGKGQRPTDVNKFLQYFNPTQTRTELPAGTQSFNLLIIYGNTIKRETFSAELNGQNVTGQFDPLPGKMEMIKIPLNQGSNTLILSVSGVKTSGGIATDTDRLTFVVP